MPSIAHSRMTYHHKVPARCPGCGAVWVSSPEQPGYAITVTRGRVVRRRPDAEGWYVCCAPEQWSFRWEAPASLPKTEAETRVIDCD